MHDFAEQAEAAKGCRRLLATILHQALIDEYLVQDGVPIPRGEWPHNGWPIQNELDTFWSSDWLQNICAWLDIDAEDVVDLAQELRDGRATVEAYTKRIVRTGSPGSGARPNGSREVAHARDAAYRQLSLWEAS